MSGNKNKKEEQKQLGLDLKFSQLESFYKLLRLSHKVEKRFTVLPFWRNGILWAAISTIIGVAVISGALIYKHYLHLPPQIPLTYDTQQESWKLYSQYYIIAVPLVLLILGFINIQLLQRVYYMNKKLTLMICLILCIAYLMTLVSINEIIIISVK